MPVYEYQCQDCGHHVEKRQKFDEAPLRECPACGGGLEKLISLPAFSLKGGGWFAEGYNSQGANKDGSNASKPAGKAADAGCSSGGDCSSCPAAANS